MDDGVAARVVPEPLIAAAVHLEAIAKELGRLARGPDPLARPGSRAATEADDRSFDDVWGTATVALLHEPAVRLTGASDHVAALAALTREPSVVLSIATLARPTLEQLAPLYWLYDPQIDVRERVRRRLNLRLESLVEQHNIAATLTPAARDEVAKQILEIKAAAGRHGFQYQRTKPRAKGVLGARYLDHRLPSDAQLIAGVVELTDSGDRFGRLVHRLTSAVTHGQTHGLLPFLLDRMPSDEPGISKASVGITMGMYASLTGAVVLAANVTVQRLSAHFGWPTDQWNDVAQPAISDWGIYLKDGLDAEPGTE